MKFADFEAQDRRLVLLRGLQHAALYRTNSILLQRYLEHVGHVTSRDRLAADLAWLAEQGLVELELGEALTVATLTARGLDVAEGRAHVPGVARPRPEA
jgi:hypothetical protein